MPFNGLSFFVSFFVTLNNISQFRLNIMTNTKKELQRKSAIMTIIRRTKRGAEVIIYKEPIRDI